MTLSDSALFIDSVNEGSAVGSISAVTSPSGDSASYSMYSTVLGRSDKEQFYANNTITWSTDDTWLDDGHIFVHSALRVVDSLNWDATGLMKYGNNMYSVMAVDKDKSGDQEFYLEGYGQYEGDWNDW